MFGLNFINPVGMGAGMDPNGEFYDMLAEMGLSFAEIGPLSPANVRQTIERIIQKKADCIPAVNIAKLPESTIDTDIIKDIVDTFELSYEFADMFILDCRDKCFDIELINDIVSECVDIRLTCDTYKPILIGLGNNLSEEDLDQLLGYAMLNSVDGVVARGKFTINHIREFTKGRLPIIAYGDIDTPETAADLLKSGASLIALTTEINKYGPGYIKRILKHLASD